ncbi:MAG: Cu2+-exporting ATPase [Cellvibrionaceae bacterium]|jgi:Cu2+-exporting ATPase
MTNALSESLATDKTSPLEGNCFHCGLNLTDNESFTLTIRDQPRHFCCAGCQSIAAMIYQGGLDKFYQYRSSLSKRPQYPQADFSLYDRNNIQKDFVTNNSDSTKNIQLLLDGIHCAACVWLIEQAIGTQEGVEQVSVNSATHQCQIRWRPEKITLSKLMEQLAGIGYRPQLFTRERQQEQQKQQYRQLLLRMAFAGFAMMQVGMVAVALYAGDIQGIETQWEDLLRWVSLLVATPVVLFSARPFWQGAWSSIKNLLAKRHGYLTMDVPVSLAIILAYCASAWATFDQSGEVYFDSIAMFTFFLLLGRYLEMRLRVRNQELTGMTTELLPITVSRVSKSGRIDVVSRSELSVGDRIRVFDGGTVPCDGIVTDGKSLVIESLLTGEAKPVPKSVGDKVIAGTINTESSLSVEVSATGEATRLSTIGRLARNAKQNKPYLQQLADRVAGYFVIAILSIATVVFFTWWQLEPQSALWITLSVLVVTCPCALSLATPAALTASVASMRQQGLLILKSHVTETLPKVDRIIFDKTGTLTHGTPVVSSVEILDSDYDRAQVLAIAAALENGCQHPLAKAFTPYFGPFHADGHRVKVGHGVSGHIQGSVYRLGKPEFAMASPIDSSFSADSGLLLTKEDKPVALIQLEDQLRESALPAIQQLQKQGIDVEILSGDHSSVVADIAHHLGVSWRAEQSPEDKLRYIREQQKKQHRILMVGDGINDIPVLAGADVSVAMDSASDFARTQADSVLLHGNLTVLPKMIRLSHRAAHIIRQNLWWALGYNITALPLAAMGYIPPYLAAIGMSASSLIVVINAMRLYR